LLERKRMAVPRSIWPPEMQQLIAACVLRMGINIPQRQID
jgi:hypothetical protein